MPHFLNELPLREPKSFGLLGNFRTYLRQNLWVHLVSPGAGFSSWLHSGCPVNEPTGFANFIYLTNIINSAWLRAGDKAP